MNKTSIAAALGLALLASSAHAAVLPKVKLPVAVPALPSTMALKNAIANVRAAKALPGLPALPGVGVIVANHNYGGFGNGKFLGTSIASVGGTGNGGAVGIALKSGPLSGNGRLVGIAAASGAASGYGRVLSLGLGNTGQPVHIGLLGKNVIGH